MKVVMEYTFKTHEDYFRFMEETEDLAERGELHFRAKTISTTDDDVRLFLTRLTVTLSGNDTGQVTRQGCTDIRNTGCTLQHCSRGLGDSTHH